jgi:hypothetical protein
LAKERSLLKFAPFILPSSAIEQAIAIVVDSSSFVAINNQQSTRLILTYTISLEPDFL